MERICVYATKDPEINKAISELWRRKLGDVYKDIGGEIENFPYLSMDHSQEGTRFRGPLDTKVITLKELEAMPDYAEQTVEIDGRKWSVDTVKEALKKHADY